MWAEGEPHRLAAPSRTSKWARLTCSSSSQRRTTERIADEAAIESPRARTRPDERGAPPRPDGSGAGLFNRASRFLEEGHEVATCVVAIRHGRASCDFGEVPEGSYAVAFFHDEDEDRRFGRDWIGLPTEGFGFSNDAAPGLGPPSYESARFTAAGATVHRVHTRYGL